LEVTDVGYLVGQSGAGPLCDAVSAARVKCLRVPAVVIPRMLHVLGRQVVTGWPRWVEFVQHLPDRDAIIEPGTIVGESAAALDRLAGRPVTRIIRPFEARFPLFGDLGHGLIAGRNEDGEPGLLAVAADSTGCWVGF